MMGIDLSALSASFGADNRYPEREEWVPEIPQADPGLYLPPQLMTSEEKKNRGVNRARLLEMVDQVEDAMELSWSHTPPPPSSLYAGFGGPQGGLAAMSQLLQFMAEHGMGPLRLYG
jgi:hypothetical protein